MQTSPKVFTRICAKYRHSDKKYLEANPPLIKKMAPLKGAI